jgi:hypothetical protein
VNNKFERMQMVAVFIKLEIVSLNLPGGTEESHEKP